MLKSPCARIENLGGSMPIIKSAIKKLRKDRKRERENDARRRSLERAIRLARKSPSTPIKSGSKINAAYSAIDKAVKRNIIHKNKAARIKSSLVRLTKHTTATRAVSKKPAPKTKRTSLHKKKVRSLKK